MTRAPIEDDPIRAEVERWLHAIVGVTVLAPALVLGRTRRCATRRAAAVRHRVERPVVMVRSLFDLAVRGPATADPVASATPASGTVVTPVDPEVDPATPSLDATELPIEEYESLAASQVVDRLPSLTAAELDVVRRFEVDHRGRRTVLGRIDQLLAPT
ncbi:MAG: hypothetical protein ABW219_04705 [Ilumatobacteraceae bacterium]